MICVTARMADGSWRTDIQPKRISNLMNTPGALVWVDLCDPQQEEYEILRRECKFHPLAIEDVIMQHQRPKIDIYEGYYFLVIYTISYNDTTQQLETHELEMFVGSNYVVTVHDEEVGEVDATIEQWRRNVTEIGVDIGVLVYTLLDRIVDDYFPVIDRLAERIEELEERIFTSRDKNVLEELFNLKKGLLHIRRVVAPERDIFNVLLRRDPPILSAHSIPYFMDVYDHTIRVSDSLDIYRDLLGSALDAYLSVQGNRLNEIMYRLALISTIFLPLTFLTGFFGMNFEHLPFGSRTFMDVALALMVLMPIAVYLFFRRHGWS